MDTREAEIYLRKLAEDYEQIPEHPPENASTLEEDRQTFQDLSRWLAVHLPPGEGR